MITLKGIFSKDYLFTIDSAVTHRSDRWFFALGIAVLILAITTKTVAYLAKNPVKKILVNKIFKLLAFVGIGETIWYGLNYQNVRFFGTHFVALLILVVGAIWFGYIVKYYLTVYKKEISQWENSQLKQKYLSRKK